MNRDLDTELGSLIGGSSSWEKPAPRETPYGAIPELTFTCNKGQHEAVEQIVTWRADPGAGRFLKLTGPAGSGKTSVMQVVRSRLVGTRTAWSAMTGKAAARMREATGVGAKTLHSTLFWPPKEVDNAALQKVDLEFDRVRTDGRSCLLAIDESSMIGSRLRADIGRSSYDKILLIGDPYQIPPVLSKAEEQEQGGDYSVFTGVEGPHLDEVMRAAGAVLRAATYVREQQKVPMDSEDDGMSVYAYTDAPNPDVAIGVALTRWFEDSDDHVIITWRNEVRMLVTRVIRKKLGRASDLPEVGEPLVVRRNVYGADLMNGDAVVALEWMGEGPTLVGIGTRYLYVRASNGQHHTLLVPVSRGGSSMSFDGNMPYVQLNEWKRAIEAANVNDPVPVTWGYSLTGHMCVHPNTLVETPCGLMKISQLAIEGEIAAPTGVKTYTNKTTNPSDVMLRIQTRDGYTIDVTPEHGVFVWDGEQYSRVEARNVKPGVMIQFCLGETCVLSELRKLPPASTHADSLDIRAYEHRIPSVVDGDTAEFFGLMVADGTLFDRGFRLVKRHRDVVLRFKELCESVFDVEVHDSNTIQFENATGVEVMSVQIARWLKLLGGMSPNEKDVPCCVLESPLEVQARFLRGLFEDGTVNLKKDLVDHVEWLTCRESLALTVHVMLLRFGIIAARRVRETNGGVYHVIYIYGANARRFRDRIGFVSKWKQDRLIQYSGDVAETRYSAPFSRDEWTAVKHLLGTQDCNNWHARRRLSRHVMKKALLRAEGDVRTLFQEKLKWHHSVIVSVDRVEDSMSMCVTVSDGNRFLQNGSPQSNSQGSEYRRATTLLPGDMSNPHFRKPTRLPTGEVLPFSMRFLYTALARAKKHTSLIVS